MAADLSSRPPLFAWDRTKALSLPVAFETWRERGASVAFVGRGWMEMPERRTEPACCGRRQGVSAPLGEVIMEN